MDDKQSSWNPGLEYAALSDVGLRRTNNQDNFAVVPSSSEDSWRRSGHLFQVADGMGAHAAGELASKLAVDNVPHLYHKLLDSDPTTAIRRAIEMANDEIHGRGKANLDFHGMGTTSSCLLLLPQGAVVGHVGDSRVYRLRGTRLDQLSFDHSLVWEMMAAGHLRESELPHVPKNVITRSLGPNADVQVDVEGPLPVAVGDTFLLCSDGLSGPVKDDELGIIMGCLSPNEAVRALIDLANLRGGPDNITAIVARVTGPHIAANGRMIAEPSTVAGAHDASPWRYVPWLLAVVCLLAGLGLGVTGHVLPAIVVAGLGVAAMVVALLPRRAAEPAVPQPPSSGRTGPYRSTNCAPNREFVDRLGEIFHQLREAAIQDDWSLDWSKVNGQARQAAAYTEAKDYTGAVRELCRAISFMMAERKAQQRKK